MSQEQPDRNGRDESDGDSVDADAQSTGTAADSSGAEDRPDEAAWNAIVGAEPPGQGDDPLDAPDRNGRARAALSPDRLFTILASPGNRFVLTYLLRVDAPTEYADLVEYVVSRVEPPGDMPEAKFRGRVAATIINESIPALRDADLVHVDGDRQLVSPTDRTDVAAPYLALALSGLVSPVTPG